MNFIPSSLKKAVAFIAATAFLAAPTLAAAAWPDKPVTLVVSYAAGGSVDVVARLISTPLSNRLGQPVVIENVAGAAGAVGAARVARAKPDGYTLMIGSGSEVAIAWAVNPNLKYNGLKDLAPIGLIATSPMVLVGNQSLAPKSFSELLQYGRRHPGKLSLATSGVGTPQHLLLEYIDAKTQVDILHVPYRSAATIVQDVIGGRVDLSIITLGSVLPFIANGKLHPYAVTGKSVNASLPSVPPLANEASLKDDAFDLWFGMLAPAEVPGEIVDRLNRELGEILREPAVVEGLKKMEMTAAPRSPSQFSAYVKADSEKYQKIIKSAGVVAK